MASVPLRGTKWCRDQPHGAGHVEGLGRFERSCGMFGDVDPVSCGMGVMVGCGMAWYCGWMDWDVKVVDGLCFFSVVLEHTSSQANTALGTLVRHVSSWQSTFRHADGHRLSNRGQTMCFSEEQPPCISMSSVFRTVGHVEIICLAAFFGPEASNAHPLALAHCMPELAETLVACVQWCNAGRQ